MDNDNDYDYDYDHDYDNDHDNDNILDFDPNQFNSSPRASSFTPVYDCKGILLTNDKNCGEAAGMSVEPRTLAWIHPFQIDDYAVQQPERNNFNSKIPNNGFNNNCCSVESHSTTDYEEREFVGANASFIDAEYDVEQDREQDRQVCSGMEDVEGPSSSDQDSEIMTDLLISSFQCDFSWRTKKGKLRKCQFWLYCEKTHINVLEIKFNHQLSEWLCKHCQSDPLQINLVAEDSQKVTVKMYLEKVNYSSSSILFWIRFEERQKGWFNITLCLQHCGRLHPISSSPPFFFNNPRLPKKIFETLNGVQIFLIEQVLGKNPDERSQFIEQLCKEYTKDTTKIQKCIKYCVDRVVKPSD